MSLGARIRQRRAERAMRSADLARAAQISTGYLSNLESGVAKHPSAVIVQRLALALGTTVADLLEQEFGATIDALPAGLLAFAAQHDLPEEEVLMLARIRLRGEQPDTPEDWHYLYESIKRSLPSHSLRGPAKRPPSPPE